MNQPILTIVLTGGGSGGHITPLLSLARELKAERPECRVVYIGLKGDRLRGLETDYKVFDEVYYVPSGKFRRYHGESLLAQLINLKTLFLNGRDFFRVIHGVFTARKILKKVGPKVVFSKGSSVAVPVGIAAHWQHLAIVTHDSDTVPGLANRIIGRWAVLHATGMPAQYYNYPKNSIRYTGVPIDERFKKVTTKDQEGFKRQLGIAPDSMVLLIGGAGLGARSINNLLLAIAPELLERFPSLQVLHLTGKELMEAVQAQYRSLLGAAQLKRVITLGFTPDFYKFSGAADVVITRAGATTLAELAVQQKAVILIPAPFLAGGHQLNNAKVLEELGAAEVLPDDVEPAKLLKVVSELLENSAQRQKIAAKIAPSARPDAARLLAEVLLEVSGQGTSN